jgi:hypothetical protein
MSMETVSAAAGNIEVMFLGGVGDDPFTPTSEHSAGAGFRGTNPAAAYCRRGVFHQGPNRTASALSGFCPEEFAAMFGGA